MCRGEGGRAENAGGRERGRERERRDKQARRWLRVSIRAEIVTSASLYPGSSVVCCMCPVSPCGSLSIYVCRHACTRSTIVKGDEIPCVVDAREHVYERVCVYGIAECAFFCGLR